MNTKFFYEIIRVENPFPCNCISVCLSETKYFRLNAFNNYWFCGNGDHNNSVIGLGLLIQ